LTLAKCLFETFSEVCRHKAIDHWVDAAANEYFEDVYSLARIPVEVR